MRIHIVLLLVLMQTGMIAQTGMTSTNPTALQVMLGNYNPGMYHASVILNRPDTISRGINARISPDSLKNTIIRLSRFHNRNTGSDTVSTTTGIGAARRWVYSRFQQISAANQNRLLLSYLQFNLAVCGMSQHRNIFAVLPGLDTTDKSIVLIEGHLDSRCEVLCDTACKAEGVEDNASGTALVLELARVMCRYSYNHTIVFMVTTGEEQGLYGAAAFATFAKQQGITIKAVLNNDVIGGIICGQTSSAPSCPGAGNLDSTHVRIFSYGAFNSPHKGLARYTKLEYKEELLPYVALPMGINVMSPEDRTGRGGDHQPFRQQNYTAVRFTSANEDGNANVTSGTYTDRQHSVRDTLGASRMHNSVIDSFFVNFPYLARNAVINGNAAGMIAVGPKQPDFFLTSPALGELRIQITQQTQYHQYRIGVRSVTNDWDSVYTMTGTLVDTIRSLSPGVRDVSVMSVDSNGIESLPSTEYTSTVTGILEQGKTASSWEVMQNKPNPFDDATYLSVLVNHPKAYEKAFFLITDITGKEIKRLPVKLDKGMNEVLFERGSLSNSLFFYTLVVDGNRIQTKEMTFAN
jgi:hypothetical protein